MTETPPQPTNGKALRLLDWARSLTVWQVLTIALLACVLVPVFVIYKAVSGNEALLNRLLSTYEEHADQSGCLVRHVKERGGPDLWSVSTAFAVSGVDRWFLSVITSHQPTTEEIVSYCESAKILADQVMDRGDHGSTPDR